MSRFSENYLLPFLFGMAIMIVVAFAIWVLGYVFDPQKCDNSTFQCRDIQVQHCMQSDEYSRDECIRLVGTGYK